jgi:hypothetical protein
MDLIKRMFKTSVQDSKKTGGVRVHLPVLRTEEQVAKLRAGYENVIANAVEAPGIDTEIDTLPVGFRTALRALVACYKRAEAEGHTELAERAQNAVAALLGNQKHLRDDDDAPFGERRRVTLIGIPGGGR